MNKRNSKIPELFGVAESQKASGIKPTVPPEEFQRPASMGSWSRRKEGL